MADFSPTNTNADAHYAILGKNTADNQVTTSAVVADADGSIVERVEYLQTLLLGNEPVTFTPSELTEIDRTGGRVGIVVSIVDRNTGKVASANIDITGITYALKKSAEGAAFSTSGITQPSGATKADGRVDLEFDAVDGEWAEGDVGQLTLDGITAAVGGTTYHSGVLAWTFRVVDAATTRTTVNTINTNLGAPANAAVYTSGSGTAVLPYIKALIDAGIAKTGSVTGASTTTTIVDSTKNEVDNFWRGSRVRMLTGTLAGQSREITGSSSSATRLDFSGNRNTWTSAPQVGDTYVILPGAPMTLAPTADATSNITGADVIGNKTDAAVTAPATDKSLVAYAKGILSLLDLPRTAATHTQTAAGGTTEQTAIENTTAIGKVQVYIDLSNLTQDVDVIFERRIDGTNYRQLKKTRVTAAASERGYYSDIYHTRNGIRVKLQSAVAEGADRSVPHELIVDERA